jgi:hypothetical protein
MNVHPIFAKILAELGMPQDNPAGGAAVNARRGQDGKTAGPSHPEDAGSIPAGVRSQTKVIPFPPVRR